jgi:hypothetical protein
MPKTLKAARMMSFEETLAIFFGFYSERRLVVQIFNRCQLYRSIGWMINLDVRPHDKGSGLQTL